MMQSYGPKSASRYHVIEKFSNVRFSCRPCENTGSGADDCLAIRLDVLSECSEPGNSVCEDLLNAVTLDNVSELISAAFRRGC